MTTKNQEHLTYTPEMEALARVLDPMAFARTDRRAVPARALALAMAKRAIEAGYRAA